MSKDQLDQIEEWKQKYFKALSKYEQQQNYDEVLQRSLGRLALAAQGLDPTLDKRLKQLRTMLKNNKIDQGEVEDILSKMEKAIGRMEETKSSVKRANTKDILTELLQSIDLGQPFKKQSKLLIKTIQAASEDNKANNISDVANLIDEALQRPAAKQSRRKFGFHLFGSKSSQTKTIQADAEDLNSPKLPPLHLVLIQLLENLSLPSKQCTQIIKLRHTIDKGIEQHQLPAIIDNFSSIVSSLGSQILVEKREYESYLKSVSSQLSSLDESILEASEADQKAFEAQHAIGQQVEDEVAGIRDDVGKADNLEQLKTNVDSRLAFLSEHIDNYRQADRQGFKESQAKIEQLNKRIQTIEQESIELQEAVEQHRQLALKDGLTGMWNRQALNEALEKEFARWQRYQTPFSMVMWDLDHFKRINDKYGHAAGDKVLKTFARTFMQATRTTDFVARFGGEEFVGVFPQTHLEEALVLANKIREKVKNARFHYEGEPVPITASAGVATVSPRDTILDDLFKRADNALYEAKAGGRNNCMGQ